jgi:N-acetyl-anhydromuramyl-L-alanine amidase AmpD
MRRRDCQLRKINRIIVHCSYTKPDHDVTVDEIRKWHTDPKPKGNGWSDIGYHFVILRNGRIEPGIDIKKIGSHAKGFNSDSVGICLAGGMSEENKPERNYTDAQYDTLAHAIHALRMGLGDHITIHGHNEFNKNKECPCFDVAQWHKKYIDSWNERITELAKGFG